MNGSKMELNDGNEDDKMERKLAALPANDSSNIGKVKSGTTDENVGQPTLSMQFIRRRNAIYSKRKYYKNKKQFEELKTMKFQLISSNEILRYENEQLQQMIRRAELLLEQRANKETNTAFQPVQLSGGVMNDSSKLDFLLRSERTDQLPQRLSTPIPSLFDVANSASYFADDNVILPPLYLSSSNMSGFSQSFYPSVPIYPTATLESSIRHHILNEELDRQKQQGNAMLLRQLLQNHSSQESETDSFRFATRNLIKNDTSIPSFRINHLQNILLQDRTLQLHQENINEELLSSLPSSGISHTLQQQEQPYPQMMTLGRPEFFSSLLPTGQYNSEALQRHLLIAQERYGGASYPATGTATEEQQNKLPAASLSYDQHLLADSKSDEINSLLLQNYLSSLQRHKFP